ncbi:hypothetical protein O1611_g1549 [Lasiodiplodia mahajangana]|uniref:Uncharacterized protein n=1 Tax=Lasiodiplodia mahajangana TaxID=1108764 RepID=A0ACC2JXC5_9PEZI|nr:hypothetical protein O1611_g1549 [Lasiodiplodia mahajangana]
MSKLYDANEATQILALLKAKEPLITRMCQSGGAPGLSVGVIHHGTPLYSHHFGHRDVLAGQQPDDETTYFIGSLTKAMVSAVTGIYVHKGLLNWTTPVCQILPELDGQFGDRGSVMTVSDLLSHRTGISRNDALWLQSAGTILLKKDQALETWAAQPLVREFRADYLYNNYGYELVVRALERLTGQSLGTCLQNEIFEPLGMTRTSLDESLPSDTNFAKAYFALQNASPFEVPIPTISDKTIMSGAGSVRSCTRDLLLFYSSFMHATNDQFTNKSMSTLGSPFKHLLTILRPHNQLTSFISLRESYALGWGRAELPCTLGVFNYNKYLVPAMPTIGYNAPSRLVVYHGGSMQGFSSAVYLLPETETAIFTLQNSTGLCDPCDWVPQLFIENVFTRPQSQQQMVTDDDFERLVAVASETGKGLASKIQDQLQQAREPNTKHRDLKVYVGKYWNSPRTFCIGISAVEEKEEEGGYLSMCLQGNVIEKYKLRHYHHDVFVWNESHDATAKRGRFQTRPLCSYKIEFGSLETDKEKPGSIDCLRWAFDETHPVPGTFTRDDVA